MSVFLYVCAVTFSRPLNGQKRECYIVEEVIEVDELNEGNLYAANKTNTERLRGGVPHSDLN